jgi:hypothetical protein
MIPLQAAVVDSAQIAIVSRGIEIGVEETSKNIQLPNAVRANRSALLKRFR